MSVGTEPSTVVPESFVGRARELEALEAAWRGCTAGDGRLLLIGGEPGIGKTQLVTTWAARAAACGTPIYWGRCREEGGTPAYWPWVQVLRALARDTDSETLAAALGAGAVSIVTAIPELATLVVLADDGAPAITPDRFTLLNALKTFFRRVSEAAPLVLILDDVHAADASSLAVLEFLAAELQGTRMLLLATYRPHEATTGAAASVFNALAARGDTLRLAGLPADAIGHLLVAVAGMAVPERQVAAIYAATDGNPLFTREVARTLAARGRLAGDDALQHLELPDTVEHVLATRLAPLSDAARDVLSVAAVIGRSFDVAAIATATGLPAATVADALQAAVDAGIVGVGSAAAGEASFLHAIYRGFFSDRLSLLRRAELHLAVARLLEARDAETHLPDIAFHLLASGPLGDPQRAAAYAQRAGDQAFDRLAYAQAARYYDDARAALQGCPRDDRRDGDLLLRLGEARFRAGESDASKRAFKAAADCARALGDGERLARAALGAAGPWVIAGGGARDDVVLLLEQGLAALPDSDGVLRARVLARLAIELQFVDAATRSRALSEEAVAIARRVGDPGTLAEALIAQQSILFAYSVAPQLPAGLALAREIDALTRQVASVELDFRGRFYLIIDLLAVGDGPNLMRQLDVVERLAAQMHQPAYDWIVSVWRATRAMIAGELAVAADLIEAAFALGGRVLGADELNLLALHAYTAQRFVLQRDRGRALEQLPVCQRIAEMVPIPLARVMLALLYCDLERWTDARDELERLAAADFHDIPPDAVAMMCYPWLAEICAALDDRPRALLLYDRLLPFAAQQFTNGNVYCGSLSLYLGLLASTLRRVPEAVDHFTTAQRHHRRMRAPCWIARTQFHLGALLSRQTDARQRRRGRALLQDAQRRARALGMDGIAALAERMLS